MKSKLPFGYWLKRIGSDLLKGAAAALAGMVGLVIGGMASMLVGLPAAAVPGYLDINRLMPLLFLSGIPAAILLGECFRRLYSRFWARAFFIFMCHYILYYLLNLLDGLLFSPLPNMTTGFFANIFPALFTALVTAVLWRPAAGQAGGQPELFSTERRIELGWRTAAAWLAFPPIYYLIGLVVGQFTRGYYEDPSHSLGLVLPPLDVILTMQVARGGLFLLAVLPVIFAWRGQRSGLWLWTGSLIFFQIAASVLFQAYWLPAAVRIPHALELLVDSFLQAGVYVLILAPVVEESARKRMGGYISHASQP